MRILTIILIATFLSLATNGQNATDKAAIQQVVLDFQDDFNEGSFKKAALYATEDWVHINPLGGIKKGRDSVLSEVIAVHKIFLKAVTMTMLSIDIRFISPDVAIAVAVHNVDPYTTPDGVKHENEKHIKTYVVARKNGRWLLELDQNTIIIGPGTASND